MSFWAQEILKKQSQALLCLSDALDDKLDLALDVLSACCGKIIISGVGKSGLVARKIAASLNCVGSPAIFLHASDALHGDMGLIQRGDVVIFISHSGQTRELLGCIPSIHQFNCVTICITGNSNSDLALASQIILNTQVTQEACVLDFLPTTSSLCSMALGDLLALGMMQRKKMTLADMQSRHPQGHLGKRTCST